jgi:phenylalanyl-tRNA synthetase alpha chain
MKSQLNSIQTSAITAITEADSIERLREIEIRYLGRKQGELALLLREVPKLPPEEKPAMGKLGNMIKTELEAMITEKINSLETAEEQNEFFDYSAPSVTPQTGHRHPISGFMQEVEDVFGRLGFTIADGPETDDEHHNFNALNIPEHHPAREMQDTFWIENIKEHVLRTQTSNVQIHHMESGTPPFRVIAPGKVFRKDSDATHSPMFHQVEGLMVDTSISLAHLKYVLLHALRELISPDLELRFRVSFFPFTEPSLEYDASCPVCKTGKKGCRVCKGTGFLEIGGAGMVHPNVLENAGVDSKKWNGFAFGFGVERLVMIRHRINDLRRFYENDLRFLEQFSA